MASTSRSRAAKPFWSGVFPAITTQLKRDQSLDHAVKTARGRVPVLSGAAESSAAAACGYVRDGEHLGADGFMLMPAMVYKTPDPQETLAHFRTVAKATGLPIMIYNNPISYGTVSYTHLTLPTSDLV